MNGRLYDPVLHRFLQPDNYVQDPFNTQNFNRYGYVLNNPLKYTDPSGEFWHIVIGAIVGGVINLVANIDKSQGFWEHLAAFGVGAISGAATASTGGTAGAGFWATTGVAAAGGALTTGTNSVIAQTGPNFSGFKDIDWDIVGRDVFVGGVSGFAGSSAGIWASKSSVLVNGINSLMLRSAVVSPIAAGAGHVAGGTTFNLLEGQSLGNAFGNSFKGIGKSMAIGAGLGVTTTMATSYANGLNPWSGKSFIDGDQLYEIGDGVRRAKILESLGEKSILAEDNSGRIFEIPIKNLRSNLKTTIPYDKRYQQLFNTIKYEGQKFPIYVNPGNKGIPINKIKLK